MKPSLLPRIAAIKKIPFADVARAVFSDRGVELAPELPAWVSCPMHGPERTPSLHVTSEFWYCHGACKTGGDALDLVAALDGCPLPEALERLEALLGLSADRAQAAAALARAPERRPTSELERLAWGRVVGEVEEEFERVVWPILDSRDRIVAGLAHPVIDWVFDELRDAGSVSPPSVSRARRERLRELREWSTGVAHGLYRDVERVTGRDRLDLALLSRRLDRRRLRSMVEGCRALSEALEARKAARKKRNKKQLTESPRAPGQCVR